MRRTRTLLWIPGVCCPLFILAAVPLPGAPTLSAATARAAPLSGAASVQGPEALSLPSLAGAELPSTGRYTIVTASGLALHRTEHLVHALRTRSFTDTATGAPIELHTWQEEQPGGARQSFYAYSSQGSALGRVRETTYVIRLADFQFDPLQDAQPQVPPYLAADADSTLHLVQFHAAPHPEFASAIRRAGGKVLRFLTDHTYLIEMGTESRTAVSQLPYVRWIGPYHPAYRVETELRSALTGAAPRLAPQRYSILLGEGGPQRQAVVAASVHRSGGRLDLIEGGGLRVEATLSQEQLLSLSRSNEVQFIDRWGGPGELDMDIIREVGGANALETATGYSGEDVRGEIFDTELLLSHREWSTPPIVHSSATTGTTYHGTSCYSINFAKGIDATAKGLLPKGQGIFFRHSESSQFGGSKSRYDINKELTDPAGSYRAVFQTSSVGSALVTTYTTISAEVDDYLFKHPILSTQSQSNTGTQRSRPQAWAKNIVSVGAFYHKNTATRADDTWNRSGSIGPAADKRIKPDLSFFYDQIGAATGTGASNYTQFGGTSGATPTTAGHFGLLFQMWHKGVWAGHGKKADVFTSRPNMATAKALMINAAFRYEWKAGTPSADIDRYKQGWGTPDLKRLLERAPVTSIIDGTDVVTPLGKKAYSVVVAAGQGELAVTLAYTDPMGTVGAAQARVNDLTLRVTSPGGTIYFGNNGLVAGNLSTAGGTSNTVDTVENVFIKDPAAGTWKVEVLGDEIVKDAHPATPAVDAVYGLVVSGGQIKP